MRPVPLTQLGAFCRVLDSWVAEHTPKTVLVMPSSVPSVRDEWLYFALSYEDRRIKVGWSVKPVFRMTSLGDWYGRNFQLQAVVANSSRYVESKVLQILRPFRANYNRPQNSEVFPILSPVAELMALVRAASGASFFDNKLAPLSGPTKHCRWCGTIGHNGKTCPDPRAVAFREMRWGDLERLEAAAKRAA